MSNKKISWHKIAESLAEFEQLNEIKVANKTICVAIHKNSLFACTAKCPHAGGKMKDGYIDALGNIVCPLHKYKFSLANGRNVTGEGYYLKTYQTKVTNDGVFIGIEESSLF